MNKNRFGRLLIALALCLAALLPACGGGDKGGLFDGLDPARQTFFAFSWIDNTYYQTTATRVAEGRHCYIFLEDGRTATPAAIDNLVAEFDDRIYPTVTTEFGSEPAPGADGDPKIFILLLDIRQPDFGSGIAGYFDPYNEYPRALHSAATRAASNQKEIFFVDVRRQTADDPFVLRTLAHEFQHMVHWEQKDHRRLNLAGSDDSWLNEAMSEAASTLCYGSDAGRVSDFEHSTASELSLLDWANTYQHYAKVAMWSQYVIDRLPDNVFRLALNSTLVGATSVDNALLGSGRDFTGLFVDWTIANLVAGNTGLLAPIVRADGHPEWTYNDISMPYIFYANADLIPPAFRFSSIYIRYAPLSNVSPTGTLTWLSQGNSLSGTLIDSAGQIIPDMTSGTTYTYSGNAYVVFRNATTTNGSFAGAGDNVLHTSIAGPGAAGASKRSAPAALPRSAPGSGSRGICGTPDAIENARWLQEGRFKVDF
jgi:hypothetical protein